MIFKNIFSMLARSQEADSATFPQTQLSLPAIKTKKKKIISR